MFKLLTGSLMLALSAFSFFSHAFDENPSEWRAPKVDRDDGYEFAQHVVKNPVDICGIYEDEMLEPFGYCTDTKRMFPGTTTDYGGITFRQNCMLECNYTDELGYHPGTFKLRHFDLKKVGTDTRSCPPDGYPDYVRGVDEDGDGKIDKCYPKFEMCPKGYFKFAVEPYGCVPIDCPAKGQAVNNITTHGKVPFGRSGTFCDGTCSYSVNEGSTSYEGAQWASGVSNGAVCGDGKTKEGANFTDKDKEGDCTTHALSNGLTYQDCSNVSEPDEGDNNNNGGGTDEGFDSEENKVDETATDPDFEGMDCGTVNDKEVCFNKNITDAINDQTKKQKADAAEQHNKLVEQQEKIANYVEQNNQSRELRRADDARQMINGLDDIRQAIVSGGNGAGGGGSSDGVISAIDGLGESLGETDIETDSEPSAGIESFYEAEYPNGFQDVWNKNKALFDASAPVAYIKQWEVSVTGTAPDWNMCFDLGAVGNFGCKAFELDPRVFPFLRIIILISTAFLCRRLVLGG
ncbi:hypothetical protein [uncultured Shewanella sp.]|uniref:hypothetical protein n=1 Tax=uncultured Shewanella sp. TaxID=173975 RepID=UPI0026249755|nr:hypothetical protein [uncultured Shewanella sp.]